MWIFFDGAYTDTCNYNLLGMYYGSVCLSVHRKNQTTADKQIMDMVHKSISVVLADPRLADMEDSGRPKPGSALRPDRAEDFQGVFGEMVAQKLGYNSVKEMTAKDGGIISQLKMEDTALIMVRINKDGSSGEATVLSGKGDILLTVK